MSFENPSDTPKSGEMSKEVMINQILEWPEELRNSRYRELVGQAPKADLSEEHIAASILEPEKERSRVLAENLEEDRNDRGYYPTGK